MRLKVIACDGFREQVASVVTSRDPDWGEVVVIDMMSDEVKFDVYVFCSRVLRGVGR
jgi:hypothetical protein